MFDQFTDRARKILGYARVAAVRFGHDSIGPEHLLIGLLDEGSGVGMSALEQLQVDTAVMRRELDKNIDPGSYLDPVSELPITPAGGNVLKQALQEARKLGQTCIGSEHLLLALLLLEDGIAARALRRARMDYDRTRRVICHLLSESDPSGEDEASAAGPGHQLLTLLERAQEQAQALIERQAPDAPKAYLETIDQLQQRVAQAMEVLGRRKEALVAEQDFEAASEIRDKLRALNHAHVTAWAHLTEELQKTLHGLENRITEALGED